MTEFELNSLEEKIDQLVGLLQKLKLENVSLTKKIAGLNNENVALSENQKNSSKAIKQLILKLRDELACQTKK